MILPVRKIFYINTNIAIEAFNGFLYDGIEAFLSFFCENEILALSNNSKAKNSLYHS